jgi:hypothetical protein
MFVTSIWLLSAAQRRNKSKQGENIITLKLFLCVHFSLQTIHKSLVNMNELALYITQFPLSFVNSTRGIQPVNPQNVHK